jgi:hypothetical protein
MEKCGLEAMLNALQQMLREVDWGPIDIMIVDLPPGTGDAQLTSAQQVPLVGTVIVSMPQDINRTENLQLGWGGGHRCSTIGASRLPSGYRRNPSCRRSRSSAVAVLKSGAAGRLADDTADIGTKQIGADQERDIGAAQTGP